MRRGPRRPSPQQQQGRAISPQIYGMHKKKIASLRIHNFALSMSLKKYLDCFPGNLTSSFE